MQDRVDRQELGKVVVTASTKRRDSQDNMRKNKKYKYDMVEDLGMTNIEDDIVKSNFLYSGLEGVGRCQEFAKNVPRLNKTDKALAMAAQDTHKITKWINSARMAPRINNRAITLEG